MSANNLKLKNLILHNPSPNTSKLNKYLRLAPNFFKDLADYFVSL